MSNQRLVIAILLCWVVLLLRQNPFAGDAHQRTARQVRKIFPELRQQIPDLAKLVISDKDSSVTVQLAGAGSLYSAQQWLVEEKEHPVDRAKLMYLLNGLSDIKGVDLVSIKEASHQVYGVNADGGTRVQAFDNQGNKVVDWIAGAIRSQDILGGDKPVFEYYMRRFDSDEVYLSGGAIQPSTDAIDWCDVDFLRGIDAYQVESISRFDFASKTSWTIERINPAPASEEQSRWQLTQPLEALIDNFPGDSLAFTCSKIKATGVVALANGEETDNAKYKFPQDRFLVVIKGNTLEFELGAPAREGHRYLRVKGLQHIYTISDFEVGQLRQSMQTLYDDND
jgi:hypothetical protein